MNIFKYMGIYSKGKITRKQLDWTKKKTTMYILSPAKMRISDPLNWLFHRTVPKYSRLMARLFLTLLT